MNLRNEVELVLKELRLTGYKVDRVRGYPFGPPNSLSAFIRCRRGEVNILELTSGAINVFMFSYFGSPVESFALEDTGDLDRLEEGIRRLNG